MEQKKTLSASLMNLVKPKQKENKAYQTYFEQAAQNLDTLSREEFTNKFFFKTFQQDLKIAV
ncbi:MAG: hypothetical protein ACI85I_000252 [Arenicella sp.]|jgi:hypothetical protein